VTFGELLLRLDDQGLGPVLCGEPPDVRATCAALLARTHPAPLLGEMLSTIALWCRVSDPDSEVERATVVNALGPLRRHYQADDAPAQGLRLLGALIAAIDAAYDAAILEAPAPPPAGPLH